VAWRLSFSLLLLLAAGCGHSRGWLVKPHQRGLLSDRLMRIDGDSPGKRADQHVLVYREGAVGGDGTAGGGCGCN
jgi:hypothetical protein